MPQVFALRRRAEPMAGIEPALPVYKAGRSSPRASRAFTAPCWRGLANPAGVDPATSALTRRRSAVELRIHAGDREGPPWSGRWDSNPRSLAPKASALPLGYVQVAPERLVEVTGLEPAADCMQSSCTTVVLHPQVVPHEACAARGTCSVTRLQAGQLGTVPSTRVPVHGQVHVTGEPRYLGGAVSRRSCGRSGGRTRTRG